MIRSYYYFDKFELFNKIYLTGFDVTEYSNMLDAQRTWQSEYLGYTQFDHGQILKKFELKVVKIDIVLKYRLSTYLHIEVQVIYLSSH